MFRSSCERDRAVAGFTLIEVVVALAIFGLMLSGILAAQAGLSASNKKAANMGEATTLARCKMTELEEKMLKLGYPALDPETDAPAAGGGQGCVRLPYLSLGSAVRVTNECAGRSAVRSRSSPSTFCSPRSGCPARSKRWRSAASSFLPC